MKNLFQKATKRAAKLRLALSGPSGSGKTYSALSIASNMGGKVALIDTEHGSASKYADIFEFDVINMPPPYHPDKYGEYICMAADAGYNVLVIDSLSHAWTGKGGLLEIVDEIGERLRSKGNRNNMAAWKEATPIHNRMIENILGAGIHIIATMRAKQEYLIDKDEKGKTRIEKVGLAPVQRDGMEYEFDIMGEMTMENSMVIGKTRIAGTANKVYKKPGKEFADVLLEWLSGDPAPVETPQEAPQPRQQEAPKKASKKLKGEPEAIDYDANIKRTHDWLKGKMQEGPEAVIEAQAKAQGLVKDWPQNERERALAMINSFDPEQPDGAELFDEMPPAFAEQA